MESSGITVEEWIGELNRLNIAGLADNEGITIREIARTTQMSKNRIRELIRCGIESGKITVCRKRSNMIDGRACVIPAYKFIKDGNG